MFKFFLYKIGQFLVTRLPVILAYQFASLLSDLQYLFSFRDRRAVCNNLRIILPDEKNVSRKAREVFRNFGAYLVEFFRMTRMADRRFIHQNVKVENIDVLENAVKNGKGAIILTAHIGNWELGAVVMSQLGYPVMAVALPHKERPVNELFNKQRQDKGVEVVQVSFAIRKCIEALKNNRLIALVADRDFTNNGEMLDFLGRKAFIPKGAAVFAVRTGAPIIPTFMLRNKDKTFTFVLEEPILAPSAPEDKESEKKVVLDVMKKYTTVLERRIRQHPTQWMMFREFWAQ